MGALQLDCTQDSQTAKFFARLPCSSDWQSKKSRLKQACKNQKADSAHKVAIVQSPSIKNVVQSTENGDTVCHTGLNTEPLSSSAYRFQEDCLLLAVEMSIPQRPLKCVIQYPPWELSGQSIFSWSIPAWTPGFRKGVEQGHRVFISVDP